MDTLVHDTLVDRAEQAQGSEAPPINPAKDVQASQVQAPRRLVFWESEHTRPPELRISSGAVEELIGATSNYLQVAMKHPYLPVSQIRAQQLARMRQLVELAYKDI